MTQVVSLVFWHPQHTAYIFSSHNQGPHYSLWEMKNIGSVRHAHVLEEVAHLTSAHISLARIHDHTQLQGGLGAVALWEEGCMFRKEWIASGQLKSEDSVSKGRRKWYILQQSLIQYTPLVYWKYTHRKCIQHFHKTRQPNDWSSYYIHLKV